MPDQIAATFAEAAPHTYDLHGSQYRKSTLWSTYSRDEGLLTIPVMGPAGTPPVMARVHAPYGFRAVEFDYVRDGAPPVFPAQADTQSGDVLLTSELAMPAPEEADTKLVFACKGRYSFLQFDTLRGTETWYPIDRHPYPTLVDYLQATDRYKVPFDIQGAFTTYNSNVMDARYMSSYGILG